MTTDTDSPLERYQRHAAACDDGIAAAERGMDESELLGAYRKDYERQKADWLLCRAAADRRIAELPRRPAHIGWRRLLTTITRGLL